MNLFIRLIKNGKLLSTRQWNISAEVNKATAQKIVNTDFAPFIEAGGSIEIIGKITQLKS